MVLVASVMEGSRPIVAVPPAAQRSAATTRSAAGSRGGEVRLNVQWSGVPLRRAMQGLSQSSGEAIVLDRRIDPERSVTLTREGAKPGEIVADVARELGLEVVNVGPVLYIVPPATAERVEAELGRQVAAARRLRPPQARAWSRRMTLVWPELAEPRTVLAELAGREKISLAGGENVPHDLWPAVELPPLLLAERLTLLLAPFDLTWRSIDEGRGIEIVPLAVEPVAAPANSLR
ncbi:MAG: hypothetical protein KF708_18195 [Pirellulales bacterium]|nr:hypothetical protein [Pirellulales bacterium]